VHTKNIEYVRIYTEQTDYVKILK